MQDAEKFVALPLPKHKGFKDHTGKKFGRLTVLCFIGRKTHPSGLRNILWGCRCDCGNLTQVYANGIGSKHTQSCGCLHRERATAASTTHGATRKGTEQQEYSIWLDMRRRCHNPKNKSYRYYGARGISVCPEWRKSFESFIGDIGSRPSPEHTLEREDNNKGYSPENCRWATRVEQAQNRRSNRVLTLNGESHYLSEWARLKGLTVQTLHNRLRRGWSTEKALTEPVK